MRAEAFGIEVRTLPMRLLALTAGWGLVGVVYTLCAQTTGHALVLPETFIDRGIPFSANPFGVLVYLSYFVLLPCAYLLVEYRNLWRLMLATQLCALVSGLVFLIYPTTTPPMVSATAGSGTLLALVHMIDTPRNCFPSLHASLSLLSAIAVQDRNRRLRSAAFLLWMLAVLWSVVRVRQHLSLDVLGGAFTAACAWVFAGHLPFFPLRRRRA